MKPPAPPRVKDIEKYWSQKPPEQSARCAWWVKRIQGGWRPSGRVSSEGYYSSAKYYGVYIWEYLNVISPLLRRSDTDASDVSSGARTGPNVQEEKP
jgi:hypothetical protein